MQIYQTHPEHGRHIAESSASAKSNIAEGWKTIKKETYEKGIQDELKGKQKTIIEAQKAALKEAEEKLDE